MSRADAPEAASRANVPGASTSPGEPSSDATLAFRVATEADLGAVVPLEIAIARISFPDDPLTDPNVHLKRLRKSHRREPDGMLLLESDGQLAGWLWLSLSRDFTTGRPFVNFRSLAVVEDFRGTDVARRLIDRAVAWGQERGAVRITGKVHAANLGMRAVYAAAGFHARHLTMERSLESTS